MEDKFNVTYITLGGHVELQKYRYLYFVVTFAFYILIICCNSTIVCLIVIHKNLHEPMYIFIAALLINSILYTTTIFPKLLTDFLSETQVITYQACLFQAFIYYTLFFSEFILLAAMAYDRYVSICKPLQYPTIMSTKTVSILLSLGWLVPACEVVGTTTISSYQRLCSFNMNVIFCNTSIYKLFCVPSKVATIYGAFGFVYLVVFPVFFIVFSYTRIFIICYHSSSEVKRKAAQTCVPHLLVLINNFILITYDVITVRLESDLPKIARLVTSLQLVLYTPLFNPIIYGLKMKEIYKHLKRLLRLYNNNTCCLH
uniref:Olfactory receptor n=1 Tax=Monopterus albus TaxID=43700 RepID=A0A3Q3JF65_MONAL